MAYTHMHSRNLSTTRMPTILPDIAELSPNLEPTQPPPVTAAARKTQMRTRTPSPTLRSASVASFVSDGTIEIDGFGFDSIGDEDDLDRDIDALSLYGAESIYEDSVFGDYDADEGAGGSKGGTRESQDLSRRAERILASAKRRLDRCGQNISRARNSIILSPSLAPTIPVLGKETPTNEMASIASVLEMDDVLGKFPVPAGEKWRRMEQTPVGGFGGQREHMRTASESAVVRSESAGARMLQGIREENDNGSAARSRSAQQMRSLRDQMKDLRGKISSLQEQAQRDRERDDVRRRTSISSLRSNHSSNGFYTTPSLEEIRESRVLDINTTNEWDDMIPSHHHQNHHRDSFHHRFSQTSRSSSRSSRSSGTQKLRDDLVTSPFSERHEDRYDAFSYDTLLIGTSFVHRRTLSSSSSTSTATIQQQPLERASSQNSISSYATATESLSPRFTTMSRSNSADTIRDNPSPATTTSSGVSSPGTAILGTHPLRPPPVKSASSSSSSSSLSLRSRWREDQHGSYHSAPQTPHLMKPTPSPSSSSSSSASSSFSSRTPKTKTKPMKNEQSWYRDSISTETETEYETVDEYYTDQSSDSNLPSSSSSHPHPLSHPPHDRQQRHRQRQRMSTASTSSSRYSTDTITAFSPPTSRPPQPPRYNPHHQPVAIHASHRDSQTMIVNGVIEGQEEVELKVGREDRLLIEGVIETLGRVCCELEAVGRGRGAERETGRGGDNNRVVEERKEVLRERLRGAMRVLEGWEGEVEMF